MRGRQGAAKAMATVVWMTASLFGVCSSSAQLRADEGARALFLDKLAPLLIERCAGCHHAEKKEGGLSLETRADWLKGGDSGPAIEVGDADASVIVDYVSGEDPEMPQQGDPLTSEQVSLLRKWIDAGAPWPADLSLKSDPLAWWSLQPLHQVAIPRIPAKYRSWARNPIDAFILQRQAAHGLTPSPAADRRTLIRRLYYDLIGLPPTMQQVEAFERDRRPDAYERLVERLLASPRYGERWARHWLDVVHYGETHGYDKDKPRPNAWHYRDYVIRSLNNDKPYRQFVLEQLAGDVVAPGNPDAFVARGFLSAGPWDFIGHAELSEEKLDGKIARNLDRDDMVTNTLNTFASLTVQCARCHDHKFDPITQDDYYALQAVFSALDRVDRSFDADPRVARRRLELAQVERDLSQQLARIEKRLEQAAGPQWKYLSRRQSIAEATAAQRAAAFGYHSNIVSSPDTRKWVEVDLGRQHTIRQIVLYPCHDDFNNIGDGFGFPVRWQVVLSETNTGGGRKRIVADYTQTDFPNPGIRPVVIDCEPFEARYVRIVATRLAERRDDYILALAELAVINDNGSNVALGAAVTSLDSIEAPARWRRANLTDGAFYGQSDADWKKWREEFVAMAGASVKARLPSPLWRRWESLRQQQTVAKRELTRLPAQQRAYVGAAFRGSGNFRGTGGQPREIHVLARGDVRSPLRPAFPGVPRIMKGEAGRFDLASNASESQRRLRLAQWLVRPDHPLTWRSIVNRIWLYHFGRGLVETPNDFGRMGAKPSHPELLDFLAVWFQQHGGSWKKLHRLIVMSAVYRQSSASRADAEKIDAGNRFLWRANRRRLEAEAVRDTMLALAGRLDLRMYGPSFQDFVIEHPEHSPHYEYGKVDPADARFHRRAIYRFLVRSQPQPMMQILDCADPSMSVPQRQQTTTPQQALVLLNNELSIWAAAQMAERLEASGEEPDELVRRLFRRAVQRVPDQQERQWLAEYARKHGLAAACRIVLNLNELIYVD